MDTQKMKKKVKEDFKLKKKQEGDLNNEQPQIQRPAPTVVAPIL